MSTEYSLCFPVDIQQPVAVLPTVRKIALLVYFQGPALYQLTGNGMDAEKSAEKPNKAGRWQHVDEDVIMWL